MRVDNGTLKGAFNSALTTYFGVTSTSPMSILTATLPAPVPSFTVDDYSYPEYISVVVPNGGAITIDFSLPDQLILFVPGTSYTVSAVGSSTTTHSSSAAW
jgi:hypothetical protein